MDPTPTTSPTTTTTTTTTTTPLHQQQPPVDAPRLVAAASLSALHRPPTRGPSTVDLHRLDEIRRSHTSPTAAALVGAMGPASAPSPSPSGLTVIPGTATPHSSPPTTPRRSTAHQQQPASVPEHEPLPPPEDEVQAATRVVAEGPALLEGLPQGDTHMQLDLSDEAPPLALRRLRKASSRDLLTEPIMRERRSQDLIPVGIKRRVSSVLRMAGISFHEGESANVRGLWNVFDADGDGIIDYDEFCRYSCDLIEIQKKKKTQVTMSSLEAKFVRIIVMEIKQLGSLQRAIESVFRTMDQNRSGRISQLEFEDGIRALGLMEYNYEVHGLKRRFANNSLFVLKVGNPLRYWAVWLVEWKWFDRFILACIITNSIMLAFRDYQDPGSIADINGHTVLNVTNRIVELGERVFSWLFVAECALKIIAMGLLFGRGAYLRSYWNLLDFFVVVVGLIGDLPGVPKISALRTARVLRPLRTLSNLRGMRMLVYALFSAIPALFNVMVILCFVFTVFGILGVLFWNGVLYQRCRTTPTPVNGTWPLAGEGRLCGGAYTCPAGQFCGSVYDPPPGTFIDLNQISSAEQWDYALTNFDNIGSAMLTLFQCITLEGWTAVMYNMQDAHNYIFATAYFMIFTVIGAFFLLQFVFAVIWERFNAANDGTAGEWDLILEDRRAPADQPPNPEPTNTAASPTLVKSASRSSFAQAMRASIRSGIVVVKRNWVDRVRSLCYQLVQNDYFSGFIVFCILLNTIGLALDEYPVNRKQETVSETINTVLTFVFCLEMALKLIGLGWKQYRADRFNLFDGVIVAVSLAELVMKLTATKDEDTGLSALRSFRLFRIMKLARSWKSLRELLQTIANSLADVANFGLLLLLLMYVFALIGMQFFANKYRFDEDGNHVEWQPHVYNYTVPPHAPWTHERPYTVRRSNFDDTIGAFTTVFQCLTEENWISVMYDGVRSVGWGAVVYFLGVMVVGNIIILNLFLAILLGNFSMDEQQVETENAIARGEKALLKAETLHNLKPNAVAPIVTANAQPSARPSGSATGGAIVDTRRHRRRRSSRHSMSSQGETGSGGRSADVRTKSMATIHQDTSSKPSEDGDNSSADEGSVGRTTATGVSGNPRMVRLNAASIRNLSVSTTTSKASSTKPSNAVVVKKPDRSLFLLSKKNTFRRICSYIVHHSSFEALMLLIISLSSIQLSIDNPLNDPKSQLSGALVMLDKVFTVVFVVEMVLKVVDVGFVANGRQSYLRDPWNALDFVILVCSSMTLFSSNKTLRSLRSFRTLRAMRPLRVISRVPGMRRVVNALLTSIPCIMNVSLVCSLIYLIFGIIGVNLFKGRFFYCDMSKFSAEKLERLRVEYGFTKLAFKKFFSESDCVREGGTWKLLHRNYDNVLKSAMTLFELTTTEGWVDLMYQAVDATKVGYHPVENWNRSYISFFIVFIIIGNFFTLNLFVGAVIDNFNKMRDSAGSLEADCESQREWLQIQELLRTTRIKPKMIEPDGRLRKICFRIQQHPRFEAFIAASVLGNTLMLALTHFQQSSTTSNALQTGNIVFWFVFLIEAVIKITSLGGQYFLDRWNLFDFGVVCGSTVSTLLPFFTKGKISPVANTLRAFRMGLAIRLMKRAQSMQDIVNTILDNMPALVNVSTLMGLLMFVYAVIGVQLYAGVMLGDALNEHANFRGVSVAMVTLFRFTTGEAWNDVMYDLMVQPIDGEPAVPMGASCVPDYTYEQMQSARNLTGDPEFTIGCSPGIQVTYIYFLSYMLVTSYVLLNLFVAVILEGFEETTEKNSSAVTRDDLAHVCFLWERYDPNATGLISDHDFLKFLRDIPPPLGLPRNSRRRDIERWAKRLELFLDHNGKVSFNAFILAAAQYVMRRVATERGDYILPAKSAESFFAKSSKLVVARMSRSTRNSVSALPSLIVTISVKRIQALARSRIARKRFLELRNAMAAQRMNLYDGAIMRHFQGNDPNAPAPELSEALMVDSALGLMTSDLRALTPPTIHEEEPWSSSSHADSAVAGDDEQHPNEEDPQTASASASLPSGPTEAAIESSASLSEDHPHTDEAATAEAEAEQPAASDATPTTAVATTTAEAPLP